MLDLTIPDLTIPDLSIPDPTGETAQETFTGEPQAVTYDLFTEELQGLTEEPIEYIFEADAEAEIPGSLELEPDRLEDLLFGNEEPEAIAEPNPNLLLLDLEEEATNEQSDLGATDLLGESPSSDHSPESSLDNLLLDDSLLDDQLNSLWTEQAEEPEFDLQEELLLDLPGESSADPLDDLFGDAGQIAGLADDRERQQVQSEASSNEDLLNFDQSEEPLSPEVEASLTLGLDDDLLLDLSDELSQPESRSQDWTPANELLPDPTIEPLASLSLDDLDANLAEELEADTANPLSEADLAGDAEVAEVEDAMLENAMLENTIANLPLEFDAAFDQPAEDAEQSILDNLSFDLLEDEPDEPLANLLHDASPNDLGIDFIGEVDEVDEVDEVAAVSPASEDLIHEPLDLPLDFLDEPTNSATSQLLSDDFATDDEDEFALPSDLLDQPEESPLANLFPGRSPDPLDRQPQSMEELLPPQFQTPAADEFEDDTTLDFLDTQEEPIAEPDFLDTEPDEPVSDSTPDAVGSGDTAIDFLADAPGTESSDLPDQENEEPMTGLFGDSAEDNWDIGVEAIASDQTDADEASLTDKLHDSVDSVIGNDLSTSSELSQAELEAQLEEFDQGAGFPGGHPTNGQVEGYLPPALVPGSGDSSWLVATVLLGVSGIIAALLGYSLWSEIAAPPAPLPSVAPAPLVPPAASPTPAPATPATPPALPTPAS